MDVQELRAMKLHDIFTFGDFLIVRVAGGWLYVYSNYDQSVTSRHQPPTMCFVQEYWFNSRAVS